MRDKNNQSLEERVEQLEQLIEKLQYTIERMQDRLASSAPSRPSVQRPHRQPISTGMTSNRVHAQPQSPPPAPPISPAPPSDETTRMRSRPMYALNSQAWLNRIGTGLLFLGLAFALKYTFEQIWFTPLLRTMSGGFVGLLLVALGLHFHRNRPHFGQALLSGGVATFYLTAFGAYQLYHLIPYSAAFISMLLITVLSFLLAARRDDSVLAIVATLGGLVTPFIMHAQGDRLLALISYTTLILIGASAMYWFRGWRSLLFVSAIGSGLVLFFCFLNFGLSFQSIASERWTLQIGTLFSLALFWALPVIRGVLRASKPEKYPAPPQVPAVGYFFNHPALPLSVTTPLATLIISMLTWDLSNELWGWIILLTSSLYGFLYLTIRGKMRNALNHLAQMQGLTAAIFLTIGLFLLYDSYSLLVALAAEAALIRVVARSMEDRLFSAASHTLFIGIGIWIVDRLINSIPAQPPILNLPAFCEFMVIVVIAAMAGSFRTRWVANTYLVTAHILFLGWIYRELGGTPDGQALITTTWGIYGVGLFLVALRKNFKGLRVAALFTMGLVVFKLFLVDLDEVEPLIRVLLFLGFGIIFLVLSYLLPNLFRRPSTDNAPLPNVE